MTAVNRRSFLFGLGALAATPILPAADALAEPLRGYVPYVIYPHSSWVRDFERDCLRHVTRWRATLADGQHLRFGLGLNVALEAAENNGIGPILRNYNRALENARKKYGFPVWAIEAAARGDRIRLVNVDGRFVMPAEARLMRGFNA